MFNTHFLNIKKQILYSTKYHASLCKRRDLSFCDWIVIKKYGDTSVSARIFLHWNYFFLLYKVTVSQETERIQALKPLNPIYLGLLYQCRTYQSKWLEHNPLLKACFIVENDLYTQKKKFKKCNPHTVLLKWVTARIQKSPFVAKSSRTKWAITLGGINIPYKAKINAV